GRRQAGRSPVYGVLGFVRRGHQLSPAPSAPGADRLAVLPAFEADLAVLFLVALFSAVDLLAGLELAAPAGFAAVFAPARDVRRGVAGPRARRSASSSAARSIVSVAISSPLRRLAFVSPSVTYGPKRPSLSTTGLPLAGSAPSSRSGGISAALRRPRVFGW